MDYYRIVSPPNAAELDAMLREQPLIGAKLRLKLREDFEGDELAARRGDEPEELEADFSAEVITTNDPLQVLGQVAIKEVIRTGRIQRRLSSSSIKELLFEEGSLPQFDGDDTLDLDQLELVID
jgi:hypothetical protein